MSSKCLTVSSAAVDTKFESWGSSVWSRLILVSGGVLLNNSLGKEQEEIMDVGDEVDLDNDCLQVSTVC